MMVRRRTTLAQEHEIRQKVAAGITWRQITSEYGVSAPTIARILRGRGAPPLGWEVRTEEGRREVTESSRCPRCGGAGGAHYTGCVLQNLLQRWLGPEYPLFPPEPPGNNPAALVKPERDEVERIVEGATQPLIETIAAMRAELDAALDLITHPHPEPPREAPQPAPAEPAEPAEPAQEEPAAPEAAKRRAPAEKKTPTRRRTTQRETIASMVEGARKFNAEMVDRARPAVEKVIKEQTVPEPGGWISSQRILDAARQINPDLTSRMVGMAMTALGYGEDKRQIRQPDGTAPIHYRGLAWKRQSEPPLDEQMKQRREAEAAAKAAAPKPPAKKEERYRYTGPRPGNEISPEYRELLKPLWDIPGWSYAPHNPNGGGKPRVTTPAGTSYVIPNTPSDFRAVKNTRAALRRLGAPL